MPEYSLYYAGLKHIRDEENAGKCKRFSTSVNEKGGVHMSTKIVYIYLKIIAGFFVVLVVQLCVICPGKIRPCKLFLAMLFLPFNYYIRFSVNTSYVKRKKDTL